MENLKQIQEFFSKPLNEDTFKVGQKVTYLGHPAVVTATKEYNDRNFVSVSYDKGTGKTSASNILVKSGDVKPLKEGKQLDQVDFAKVVKAVEQTGHPVTVLLVPKFNEIEVITGMDAPDDMLFDLSNAVDALGYGRNDIFIAADSSNLSRREYSDIRRVNGGAKDYFEESLNENEDPIIVKYFKRGDEFIQILVKYEITVGFTTALGSRTALGQQNDQNEAAAQKRVKTIVNNLKANFDLDEIFVEEGQVAGRYYINAFSDDFIDMDVSDIEKAKLNEFGPMRGSGNRDYSTSDLVNRIGELDDILMFDRKAEREWEDISQNYLGGEEGSEYTFWADLSDQELQDAIDDAESLIKKYKIQESVNEAKGGQIKPGDIVKNQHGNYYMRVDGKVGRHDAYVRVTNGKPGKRKTGLHNSFKLTLVNKGELEKSVNEGAEDIMDSYNDVLDLVKNHSRKLSDDDSYAFGLKLKSWFNKNILDEATKKEYNALLDKEHELTKAYSKDKTDANWKKLSAIRKKGKKLEKELEDQGLLEYNTGLDYHPSKEKSSSNSKKSSLKKVKDMIKRAVKEGDITVDDKTEFKLNLKHLLDKHIIQKEDLSDYEETEADYNKLYSNYAYKAVKEVFEEKGFSKYLKSKDNPKGETDGLTPDVLNKILMNVVKDIKETNQVAEASKGALNYFNDLKYYYQKAFRYLDVEEREEYKQLAKDFFSRLQIDDKVRPVGLEESSSSEEKRIAKRAIKSIAKYRGVGEDEARNDLIRAAKELGSLEEAVKEIFETIELGQNLNEELCPKGKAYIKKRQAAGEKSSAYLSGRAVKVCKGQMKG